jgi:golgi phosphoprotein 3
MKLKLSEEFVLLALDDAKGKFITDSFSLHYGLAGALLLDLGIAGKVHIEENRMVLHDPSPVGDLVLDMVMDLIKRSGTDHTIRYWIRKVGNKGRALKGLLLDQLVEKNILVKEKGTVLWIFSTSKYLPINASPENLVKEKLKKIALHDEHADQQSLLLLSLISSCKLVKEVFRSKNEYTIAKKRIAELTRSELLGKAVDEEIKTIHAAVAASIAASTVATTAASSN